MNILKKTLALVAVSVASLASVANADSSTFAGPYLALQASAIGVEIDGSHTDNTLADRKTNNGSTGMIGNTGSVQAGYNLPVSDMVFITIGGTHTPTGEASMSSKSLGGGEKFDIELSDIQEVFIEPSFMVASNAAMFLHIGRSTADIAVSGNEVTNKTTNLDGDTFAVGLKVMTDSNIFLKAEAGQTSFDELKVTGIGDADEGTTATAKGSPTVAFGTISVGYKF
jgi:hypothetical protein